MRSSLSVGARRGATFVCCLKTCSLECVNLALIWPPREATRLATCSGPAGQWQAWGECRPACVLLESVQLACFGLEIERKGKQQQQQQQQQQKQHQQQQQQQPRRRRQKRRRLLGDYDTLYGTNLITLCMRFRRPATWRPGRASFAAPCSSCWLVDVGASSSPSAASAAVVVVVAALGSGLCEAPTPDGAEQNERRARASADRTDELTAALCAISTICQSAAQSSASAQRRPPSIRRGCWLAD